MTSKQTFDVKYKEYVDLFDAYLGEVLSSWEQSSDNSDHSSIQELFKAIRYSLLGGGKRFRPVLSLAISEVLSLPLRQILPWCAAVEMIHTYSLIHDDLPCMDNDEFRRGRATNHKVFGESLALLTGDALLTESFGLLAQNYSNAILKGLVILLSESSGIRGMLGGQVTDMDLDKKTMDGEAVHTGENKEALILKMHSFKTGRLIRAAACGAGVIREFSPERLNCLREFGDDLGAAFQIADDLLDFRQATDSEKLKNLAHLGGETLCQLNLSKLQTNMKKNLNEMSSFSSGNCIFLEQLIEYNIQRSY